MLFPAGLLLAGLMAGAARHHPMCRLRLALPTEIWLTAMRKAWISISRAPLSPAPFRFEETDTTCQDAAIFQGAGDEYGEAIAQG
jgi:hypothetical protein